jgi:hypothetical protein
MPLAHHSVVHRGFNEKGHAIWAPNNNEVEVHSKVVDAPKKAAPKKTEGAETK